LILTFYDILEKKILYFHPRKRFTYLSAKQFKNDIKIVCLKSDLLIH